VLNAGAATPLASIPQQQYSTPKPPQHGPTGPKKTGENLGAEILADLSYATVLVPKTLAKTEQTRRHGR